MMEQGAALFNTLIVALGINPAKRYLFSETELVEMLRASSAHLSNVRVASFSNRFLIDFASLEDHAHNGLATRAVLDIFLNPWRRAFAACALRRALSSSCAGSGMRVTTSRNA